MLKLFTPLNPGIPDGILSYYDWLGINHEKYKQCTDIDEVLKQDLKVACISVQPFVDINSTLNFDLSLFDLVLVSDIEFNSLESINSWLNKLKVKNYLLALGQTNFSKMPDNVIYRPWWSFNILNNNQFQDSNNTDKPLLFDILLGARKSHRDFIMAKMQKSQLLKKSIVNYRDIFFPRNFILPAVEKEIENILNGDPLWFPYVSENLDPTWEVADNLTNAISSIVPWKFYQQTKYSVLSETIGDGAFFFSEKPAKIMFAKRLFVVFSSHGYLENIKRLGFKTFDGIVDESYDNIVDPVQRYTKAFEQLEYLSTLDYDTIKDQIAEIAEYNYQQLLLLQQQKRNQMLQMVDTAIFNITGMRVPG